MKFKNVLYIFSFLNFLFAQQISMSDIQKLSNQQLDAIKDELKSTTPISSTSELSQISSDIVELKNVESEITKLEYFGYSYFSQDVSFFDNIPTPSDYMLGPGDEIIISLWGEINSRKSYTVDKDGMIFYENIGFINISNNTLESANELLNEELSRIYSTLKDRDNPTKLMISLGKLKSINIYMSGHVNNPGVNLVHPFSDIFSSIIQAGGVDLNGSLRDVQLIRNDKIITSVDFYSFFMDGKNNFSKTRILDGDVIHIPRVKKRVKIDGKVLRPNTYELLSNESVLDLINYASGLSSNASSQFIVEQIIPIDERKFDDNAKKSAIILSKDSESIILNDGASIFIPSISDVDLNVEIFGAVKNPGNYPHNSTLLDVLNIAGGFNDPEFRKRILTDKIVILRKDQTQFYGQEFIVNFKDAENFELMPNDKIFVYEDINYNNSLSYEIKGEVNRPGVYSLKVGTTIKEAILAAGGLTELGSVNSLSVLQNLITKDKGGNSIVSTELVGNTDLSFEISDGSQITVLPKTNVIKVDGNVYNPGLVSLKGKKRLSMSNAIELAGGYKPYSLKKNAYVIRANGEIEQANLFRGRAKSVYPGDSIFVPADPDPDEFDISVFLADLTSTLANLAAILVIADNN